MHNARIRYLEKMGKKLSDPVNCQKSYWKIINRVMNRCRAPKIPPLFDNGTFIVSAKEKACEFMKYFSAQCKLLVNNSILPEFQYLTD